MIKEFPVYLLYKNTRIYSINGYIGESEYKDNKGYIDKETGRIYICSKDEPPLHKDVPVLLVNEDGSVKKVDYHGLENEVFDESRLHNLAFNNIIENTTGDEVLYNEEALADMNAATSIFVPTINPEDDQLKRLIKQAIISKKIDINRLKHKMPQKYGLTNMKSALIGKTKMSIINFNIWCELLGITYEICLYDNGTDTVDPLQKVIRYSSDSDNIDEIN